MSINGVLEDLALADLLQFIHLGRRTGTLYLWQDEERRAEIGFHDGRIVSAWTPGHEKLGGLLRPVEEAGAHEGVGAPRKLYEVTPAGREALRAEAVRQAEWVEMARSLDLMEEPR